MQTGSESPAMGGLSLPLHQSSAHPRSPETRGRHAFEEGDSSRRVEVAPRVGSDDLEPLRESGVGSVHHEHKGALPAVLLPVSLPAVRGHADIVLASSQAVCVSSATGVMQDQGGASFSKTHHPEPAEPALVPRHDRTSGGTALAGRIFLSQVDGSVCHPNPELWSLHVWLFRGYQRGWAPCILVCSIRFRRSKHPLRDVCMP